MRNKTSKVFKIVFILLTCITALSFSGCMISPDEGDSDGGSTNPPEWAGEYTLPDEHEAMARVLEIYGSEEKTYLLQPGKIMRMPCPENGAAMRINVACEMGRYAKIVFEDSVAEFNDVFAVINPNYKFEINYSPETADFESEYSIKLTSAKLQSEAGHITLGKAPHSFYGNTLCNFGIVLNESVLTNGSYMMTTFKHELMHLLGAGDAYNNPNAENSTVMQRYTVNGWHNLSRTDVDFLDALYRNPKAPFDDGEIAEFIENYENITVHNKANNISAVYSALVDDLSGADFAEMLDGFGYADASELVAITADGLKIDETFGSASVSFTELEYFESPETTYFGSFDVVGKKYWHGTQKSSISSSFGIGYVDYGGGILYSNPNGSNYTLFVKTGGYVLLFRLNGGFTRLDEIGLSLWHACN